MSEQHLQTQIDEQEVIDVVTKTNSKRKTEAKHKRSKKQKVGKCTFNNHGTIMPGRSFNQGSSISITNVVNHNREANRVDSGSSVRTYKTEGSSRTTKIFNMNAPGSIAINTGTVCFYDSSDSSLSGSDD